MVKNNEKKKEISGGKKNCIRLRLIRLHWYGGRCMWKVDGKQCEATHDLELAHAIETELSISKPSSRSSWHRLKETMEYPEIFLLFCPEHHMQYDGRNAVMIWKQDYYSKVNL